MHEAQHPRESRLITVPQYIQEFGRLPLGYTGPDYRPSALCPFCKQALSVVGDKSNKTTGHFSHKPKSGFCPSKSSAGKPYLDLTPRVPNPAGGQAIRRAFMAQWQLHYLKLESMVPALHYKEFISLLGLADQWRIWEYAGLSLGDIPYVLIVLADFRPATGQHDGHVPKRRLWIRFLYDSSLTNIEDLWIRPTNPPELRRVTYVTPVRGGAPNQTHLMKSTPIPVSSAFLSAPPTKAIPGFIIPLVEAWFTRNWTDL